MRLLLLSVLGLAAAALGVLAAFQRHLIYPGAFFARPAGAEGRPAPAGTTAITLTTPDAERLIGFWRPPAPGCGVVLSFHGNASAPEPLARRFTDGPWATGWGVLAIAYRGYPGSTGQPSEDGLVTDGLTAHAAVAARAPGAPILLHGHSLGAAVAVAVAARRPHLGLYLEAPFDSLSHLVAVRFPLVPRLFLRDTYRSDLRIGHTTGPVFVVHGLEDRVIPVKLAHRLATLAGPRARLDAIAGDHVSILGERDAEAQAAFRAACRPAVALAP